MNGVEIHDMHPRGYLAFDLQDILFCLRDEVIARTWKAEGVECTGQATPDFALIEENSNVLSGSRLIELSQQVKQIIWGTFTGRLPNEEAGSIVIKAIDSSFWEVFASNENIAKLRPRFNDIRPTRHEAI